MPTETKPKGLHRKLAEVMAEADRIPKNGQYTGQGGFKFVQVGDAADAIRAALGSRGVSMLPTTVEITGETEHATRSGGTMTTLTVRTTWTLTDGETGETAVIQSIGTGADSGDKASPKAQTNAMKYALLMGFLLSTGDDPERSDSSDRQSRGRGLVDEYQHDRNGQTDLGRPELERTTHENGLTGTVQVGKPPCDLQVRQTPEGPAWGFKLAQGRKGYQALAIGPLADTLSQAAVMSDEAIEGQTVTVYGRIEMVPWKKIVDGVEKDMPAYARIAIERMSTKDWTFPPVEPEPPVEAESIPLFDEDDPQADFEAAWAAAEAAQSRTLVSDA